MSSLPVVPPRPSKGSPSDSSAPAPPSIPARPARSRSKSPLPTSGEAVPEVRLEDASTTAASSERPSSPETRRKIDPSLDLHAPMAVRPAGEAAKPYDDDNTLPPEIGQRVPMLDFAGDVQAPTPLPPDSRSASRGAKRRSQHAPHVPVGDGPMVVGDYGAYPTGNIYRQNGSYSLSHDDLIKSVMHAKGAGVATTPGLEGVPDEEIGYLASDEIFSRNATPQTTPGGVAGTETKLPGKSPLAAQVLESENDVKHQLGSTQEGTDSSAIYGRSHFAVSSTSLGAPTSGRQTPWEEFQDEHHDGTPILASDEAGKFPVWNPPAISPRLNAQEVRRPPSSTKSRQSPSLLPEEDISEPPSPTKEHVPLFPAGAPKPTARPKINDKQNKSFPSQDIWEDAPESVHVTYEAELEEEKPDPEYYDPRAKRLSEASATAAAAEAATEAAKDSSAAPPLPTHRPAKRVPTDETSPISPDSKQAPTIPERPKPSIPPRPAKKGSETTEGSSSPEELKSPPATKPKPMVPPKVGGGIAALRANFMNDLNSRLSKGPQAPKKEEVAESPEEPKDREPLEDVRKSRARGPAKRKPTATAGGDAAPSGPKLTFSSIITVYSIGDDYEVSFDETKFDDEPSKIARPMHVEEAPLKGEDVDTTKEVVAIDTSAAISPEVEAAVTEGSKPEPTEERATVAL